MKYSLKRPDGYVLSKGQTVESLEKLAKTDLFGLLPGGKFMIVSDELAESLEPAESYSYVGFKRS